MKFRIVAGIVLLIVLFGLYVVGVNTAPKEDGSTPVSEESSSSGGYGGLGK